MLEKWEEYILGKIKINAEVIQTTSPSVHISDVTPLIKDIGAIAMDVKS